MKARPTAVLVLTALLSVPAFGLDRITDHAGVLTAAERATLTAMIDTVSETYRFDLVIVTERSIGGAGLTGFADDFFDNGGFGFGPDSDGSLLLHVSDAREFRISGTGRGIRILGTYAGVKLRGDIAGYLREGRYFEAYQAFILNWEEFLQLEAVGRNYNFVYRWNGLITLIAWLLSFGIAFLIVTSWKGSMNTALKKTQAASYMVPGSLSFKEQKDSFLYSTVTKTKKDAKPAPGGGGGTHTGSSGKSHGGRGGKY